MQLFTSPTTPFGRKIAVQIAESGLSERVTITLANGNPLDPGTMPLDRNPLGKIPALVTEGGMAIFDSRVISRYLDEVSGAGLYPEGAALWSVLTLESLADGIMDAAILVAYELRLRPAEARFAPWADGQWAKVSRALDAAETRFAPLLDGPLTMAQIALACALGYLDFRHTARDWREGKPSLTAFADSFSRRPSMTGSLPKG